MTAVL